MAERRPATEADGRFGGHNSLSFLLEDSISVPGENIRRLQSRELFPWLNPNRQPVDEVFQELSLRMHDSEETKERLAPFALLSCLSSRISMRNRPMNMIVGVFSMIRR